MKITVHGCRGAIATPEKTTYGGDTTCYEFQTRDGQRHIFDAGTGIAKLSRELGRDPLEARLYLSHGHLDHIVGLTGLAQLFDPRSKIHIYSEQSVRDALNTVIAPPMWPVKVDGLPGIKSWTIIKPGQVAYEDDCTRVATYAQRHPDGGSLGFRITEKETNATTIFGTDNEIKPADLEDMIRVLRGATLAIMDGEYTAGCQINGYKEGWGHSTVETNLEVALRAQVPRLIHTHLGSRVPESYYENNEVAVREAARRVGVDAKYARQGEVYLN